MKNKTWPKFAKSLSKPVQRQAEDWKSMHYLNR